MYLSKGKIIIDYEKFYQMIVLIGDNPGDNVWRDPFYLLVLLFNCLEIRIPYLIEKNYNFFSEDEIRLLENLYFEIKTLIDANETDALSNLNEINQIMNEFLSLHDTINSFFELRLYIHKRDVLLIELRKCLNEDAYMEYRRKLYDAGADIEKLKEAVQEGEKVLLEDWKDKLTDPNKYQEGEDFAFICHAGDPRTSSLVSASLLTNRLFATYSGMQVLFILDPSSMFNTNPSDCFINNNASDPLLAKADHLFSFLTKDTLEEQTLKRQESFWDKNYNEVNLYEFRPVGIIVMLEDEQDTFHYNIGEEMHKKYPYLPVVHINKSLYRSRNV